MSIGRIVVRLTADSAQFIAGMRVSERQVRQFAGAVARYARTAALAFTAAMTAMTVRAMREVDQLAKLSDQLGIATETLAGYDLRARLTGTTLEQVTNAQNRFSRVVVDASRGLKTATDALGMLGLSYRELLNLTPEQQMERLADAIKGIENPTLRAAAAQQIFGRAGAQLLNFLRDGSAGLREAKDEATAFGVAVSRQVAARIELANDSLTKMNAASRGLGATIASELSPFIHAAATAFINAAKKSDGFRDSVKNMVDNVVRGAGYVADAWRGVRVVFNGLLLGIQAVRFAFLAVLDSIVTATNRALNGLQERIRRWAVIISTIPGPQASFASGLLGLLGDPEKTESRLREMLDSAGKAVADAERIFRELAMQDLPSGGILEWVDAMRARFDALAEAIADKAPDIVANFDEMEEAAAQTFRNMTTFSEQAARNMQNALADFLFDPFDKGLKGMLQGFINVIRRMIAESAALKILGDGTSGFFASILSGLGLPNIPGRATGGPMMSGKPYMVGEHGPELVIPNTASRVSASGGGVTVVQNNTFQAGFDPAQAMPMLVEAERAIYRGVEQRLNFGYFPA
jgi:hypothetical protein